MRRIYHRPARLSAAHRDAHDTGSSDAASAPEVHVRPLAYVADEPVVRRIGDRDLYIGNALAAHPVAHDTAFRYVLSATRGERPLTTHHHPLDDGPGNAWTEFEAAVDTARQLHRRDGSLLVHCRAGISRSSTLIATVLAVEEDRRFADALAAVQAARPHAAPTPHCTSTRSCTWPHAGRRSRWSWPRSSRSYPPDPNPRP